MNLDKLKEAARRFEQKEDWRRAIEVYQRALSELEAQGEQAPDPSVYNRVGDLYLKVGEAQAAIRSYDRALDLYADQGFLNNAIALGGKILRVDAMRTPTHLRLAQLHARKNVVPEVRRHLGEYLRRMHRDHQLAAALKELRSFATQDCRNAEMRSELVDLVGQVAGEGPDGAALGELLDEIRAIDGQDQSTVRDRLPERGGGLIFLDTGRDRDFSDSADEPGREIGPVEGLNTVEATLPSAINGLPVTGFEPSEFEAPDTLEIEQVGGIEIEESSFDGPLDGGVSIGLEAPHADPMEDVAGTPVPLEGLTPTILDIGDAPATAAGELEFEVFDSMDSDDLLIDFPPAGDGLSVISLDEEPIDGLEVEAAPAPPSATTRKPALEPVQQIESRMAACESTEDWEGALAAAAELVRREPDQIPRFQKQVELAYRAGDRTVLTARYLELGDALLRQGMRAPAVAVYQRVLEHEPGDTRALGALASLGVSVAPLPAERGGASGRDYVDLGALILDDAPVKDSRMRVDAGEPEEPENEDANFREILEQFKRGIEENLDSEDFQAHYDLGIAFKEMGLLDEAIAQFQRALRSPEGRLRASEALGIAFHDKGRPAIAEAVLTRAIEGIPGADDEKIGLIYWLGRSLEAQGRETEALPWYERALAVDIRFLDLGERLARLGSGRAP
ncbi:MAG TPA: tetratricopeptide repeat protein [Gemmatimonadales bacterium]|nr:tetratricopeptide repeat protein [Gemmatimonadales bacterium]